MAEDKINPSHYKVTSSEVNLDRVIRLGDLQAIDVIEAFGLGYHLGCSAKYILRAGKKQELGYQVALKEIEDLEKSVWYTLRQMQNIADKHGIAVSPATQAKFDLVLPPKVNLSPSEVK